MELDVLLEQSGPLCVDKRYWVLEGAQAAHYEAAGEQFARPTGGSVPPGGRCPPNEEPGASRWWSRWR